MSDVTHIVQGLNTPSAYFVYSLVILVGVYKFLHNFVDKFIDRVIAQLSNINDAIKETNRELSKTRETLVSLQHDHVNLEGRVYKIEDKIK